MKTRRQKNKIWQWLVAAAMAGFVATTLTPGKAGIPPARAAEVAPWFEVMSEGFEGAFPSGAWTRYDDNGGAEHLWGRDPSYYYSGAYGAWPAKDGADGILPTLGHYPDFVASRMVYGPFDLSDAEAAHLDFYYSHVSPSGEDYFCWQASADGITFYGPCTAGSHPAYTLQTLDLTNVPTLGNLTGDPSVWIQFKFNSNGSNNNYQGPWVDDIAVWKYPTETVVINEIDPGSEDRIEFFNAGSHTVDMTGMDIVAYDDYGDILHTYTFPSFSLAPASFVVVHEGSGTDTSTDLYANHLIGWEYAADGASALEGSLGDGVDFVRWGGSAVVPPAGAAWTGSNPGRIPGGQTLGRHPNGADTDDGGDWCAQLASIGSQNTGCWSNPPVVINEIDVGGGYGNTSAAVELFNPHSTALDLTGWQLYVYSYQGAPDTSYTFPAFTLPAGGYVVLHEGSGTDTATDLYLGAAVGWYVLNDGAAALTNAVDGVDFVRWGGSPVAPPSGTSWTGTDPPIPGMNTTLGRDAAATDTDDGADWSVQTPTLGSRNQRTVPAPMLHLLL